MKTPVKKAATTKVAKPASNRRWTIMAIINIIAFIAVLVVNYLAVSLPLGGMTT
ncbi:MAG: hypothetical protein WCG98_01235 [bacterium]